MGDNSRDMVASISDIVWAINPDNDDGKKLVQRMENFAIDTCAVKKIMVHFKADEKINSIVLPVEYRKNIYLVFKEALINAVKYSNAGNIWVTLSLQSKQLSLSVKDDGTGFNEKITKNGNGLKNMRTRTNEMKGTITIDSSEEKGTMVSLHCSL
jgi:signal transduction histidine kinase